MKKFYISILSLLLLSTNLVKPESCNSVKMSLVLNKNKEQWGTDILNKDLNEYINALKKLAEIQKKRKLTIEELNFAYCAFIYIFTALHEDYAGKIVISVNDKDTLNLPFSVDILINLISSILQEQNESNDIIQKK